MGSTILVCQLVAAAAAAAAAESWSACPSARNVMRYGSHSIPKQVFYTGKTNANLSNLTWGDRGVWPEDYNYHFYGNDDMIASMQRLDRILGAEGVPGVLDSFNLLRPWAFKADLWRYCILWACGGIYVDSKLAIAEDFDDFLWNAGFNPAELGSDVHPKLYSCRDDLATQSMHPKMRATCFWQGLLIAEPRNLALLQTIKFSVSKVQERWYPPYELSKMPWLFLTGPGAIGLATHNSHAAREPHVMLRCRMTYTTKKAVHDPLQNPHLVGDWHLLPGENASVFDDDMSRASFVADENLHESQRTNSYGVLFKAHQVYLDDNSTLSLRDRSETPGHLDAN